VLDVTPTILHLMGLPVGEDMDGKVLVTALENAAAVTRLPTWDDAEISSNPIQSATTEETQAMLDQLVALGYLEAPDANTTAQRDLARREIQYNRIGSLLEAADFPSAVIHARELAAECPQERRYRLKLIQTLLHAQLIDDAQAAISLLEAESGPCSATQRMAAHVSLAQGNIAAAMQNFQAAEARGDVSPDLLEQIGWALLRQRKWKSAETKFRAALELDADRAHTLVGLARALVRQDQDEAALESALQAVGLLHFLPLGHFQLGAILSKMGDYARALQSFGIGLTMQPGNTHALRYCSLLKHRLQRLAFVTHEPN
jgi:tetratricopeptide (TPR) repeat protein